MNTTTVMRRGKELSVDAALREAKRDVIYHLIHADMTTIPTKRYTHRKLQQDAEREVKALEWIAEMRNAGIERKVLTI